MGEWEGMKMEAKLDSFKICFRMCPNSKFRIFDLCYCKKNQTIITSHPSPHGILFLNCKLPTAFEINRLCSKSKHNLKSQKKATSLICFLQLCYRHSSTIRSSRIMPEVGLIQNGIQF